MTRISETESLLSTLLLISLLSGFSDKALAEGSTHCDDSQNGQEKPGYHHDFGNAEKWVKKFNDPSRDKWQKPDEVIKELQIGAADKIADIGAGTGYFSLRIAERYPAATVYAADLEPDMIAFLQKQSETKSLKNHLAILISDNKLKLPEKINLALIVDTYHHIDERVSYFRALKKQLLQNGKVAIIDFTAESPEGPPPQHRIAKEEVESEMGKAGYVMERQLSLPYQYFLIFKPAIESK